MREPAPSPRTSAAIAVTALLLLSAIALFAIDVALHPERETELLVLPDGDRLVRTQLVRWITGSRYELRRLHQNEIVATRPDWPTNLVSVEHGVVEISREARITILDHHLAPLAEIVPPPGTRVLHSLDWISGLLVVRSRPLEINRENQIEVRDGSTLELIYRAPLSGTSVLLPLRERLFAMDPREGVHEVTREGLVPFSDAGVLDPCLHRDGFAWVRASDASMHSRTLDGSTIALDYDASGQTLLRCLVCPEGTLVVITESTALQATLRWEGDPNTAFMPGLDPAEPTHVVLFDASSGARRGAYSSSRMFLPFCVEDTLRDGDLVLDLGFGD